MDTDNTGAARSPSTRPRKAIRPDEQIEIRERCDVAASFIKQGFRVSQRRPGYVMFVSDWK